MASGRRKCNASGGVMLPMRGLRSPRSHRVLADASMARVLPLTMASGLSHTRRYVSKERWPKDERVIQCGSLIRDGVTRGWAPSLENMVVVLHLGKPPINKLGRQRTRPSGAPAARVGVRKQAERRLGRNGRTIATASAQSSSNSARECDAQIAGSTQGWSGSPSKLKAGSAPATASARQPATSAAITAVGHCIAWRRHRKVPIL